MKKTIALFISIIMLLLLTTCGSNNAAVSPESDAAPPTVESTSETTETGVTSAPAKISINLDYASDQLLAEADKYDKYEDADSEYQIQAVFTTTAAVEGFAYVSLSFDDSTSGNGDIRFKIENVLYTPAQLTPERPFVVTILVDGTIPNRGITYIDENGATRYFTISMSGQDDSLLLTEFVPAD